jgi:hypothetical protein
MPVAVDGKKEPISQHGRQSESAVGDVPDHPGIRQVVIRSPIEPPQLLPSPQGDFLRGEIQRGQ